MALPVATPSLRILPTFSGNDFTDMRRWSGGLKSGRGRRSGSSRFSVCCDSSSPPSKIVTFLGKGGVGKTFSAVLAAQYYASLGLRTALAVQSQDPTAEFLLGGKLGTYAAPFKDGSLSAFRLEATKEPWSELKQADAELKISQGALDEVVSEELGILPGMDAILAIGLLNRLSGFTGDTIRKRAKRGEEYDVVVYDGPSSEETLRIFGSAERARWYLRRLRSLAERTDTGRVAVPSILKAVETFILERSKERSTGEIWDTLESIFSKIMGAVADPKRFGCYVVTNPSNKLAHDSALRYWGCAVQAGVHVDGALCIDPLGKLEPLAASAVDDFSPLTVKEIPKCSFDSTPDWKTLLGNLPAQGGQLFGDKVSATIPPAVAIDKSARIVSLFLPGFPKSEIRLSQWRENTELLVEAGDQRRSILLPSEMRGKVIGAKFQNKSLVVTIGSS